MRILILGARAPVALELARRFAADRHTVTIADSVSCRLSGSSRSVIDCIRLPPARFALADYARVLAREIDARSIDLVIPTCEEVFYLARVRDLLPDSCSIFAPRFELLRRLHSKLNFIELARANGCVVPDTFAVSEIGEARDWAGGKPMVLKPEFSRFGVHVRIYPEGIPADALPLPPLGQWAAQTLCRGTEVCSYAIASEGSLKVNICYAPTYRVSRSSSYYFEALAMPLVDQAVSRLVKSLCYTGQISFDWIVSADGTPHVLECNPRAISGVHLLPADSDVAALVTGCANLDFDAAAVQPAMLAPIMLAIGLPTAIAAGDVPRWWRDWRRARDVLVAPGDPMPVAGALADLASYLIASFRQGCSMREASTRDIEWDGQPLST